MGFSDRSSQPKALAQLKNALSSGRLSHAYLFAGPENAQKEQWAKAFAQALVCQVQPGEGCGKCSQCRRVAQNQHPDVQVVGTDQSAPSKEIKIDQVRQALDRLAPRPLEAEYKIAIVLDADRMNFQAQNAFLKTLEEPTAETVIVLVSSYPNKLLSTLHSRCIRVAFVPEVFLEQDGVEDPIKEAVAQFETVLEQGALHGLLKFAESQGTSREKAENLLRALLQSSHSKALSSASPEIYLRRFRRLEETLHIITVRNGSPRLHLEHFLIGERRGG